MVENTSARRQRQLTPTRTILHGTLLTLALTLNWGCSIKKSAETPVENSSPALTEDSMTTQNAVSSTQAQPYERRVLPNGFEVFLVKKTEVPMLTILVAAKNGAYTEAPDYNGLSHLYEHMFFKANQKKPNQSAFMAGLDEMGVEMGQHMNAYTSTE